MREKLPLLVVALGVRVGSVVGLAVSRSLKCRLAERVGQSHNLSFCHPINRKLSALSLFHTSLQHVRRWRSLGIVREKLPLLVVALGVRVGSVVG